MIRQSLTAVFLLVFAALSGCGDDDPPPGSALGFPCRGDRDCFSRCEEGFCTFSCNTDPECGAGAACIDEHGGVCAPLCRGPADCGPGFACRSTDLRDGNGSVPVCRG